MEVRLRWCLDPLAKISAKPLFQSGLLIKYIKLLLARRTLISLLLSHFLIFYLNSILISPKV